jgi:hypothetical protein
MKALNAPFKLPVHVYNDKKTISLYKRQEPKNLSSKQLKADQVTFRGNENKENQINKAQAIELLRSGARVFHTASGTYHFIDRNGRILEATELLQDAIDAGELGNIAIEQTAEALEADRAAEIAAAIIDYALAGWSIK